MTVSVVETHLRFLYEAEHPTAYRFRYGLLTFDLFTILFIVGTSFVDRTPLIAVLDIVLGFAILTDFVARLMISQERLRCLLHLSTWADIVAIASFLAAPFLGEGGAFLRVLRTLRLCTPISSSPACARTARGSGAMRRSPSRWPTSRCSSS